MPDSFTTPLRPARTKIHWALPLYGFLWHLALPFLRRNKRIADGFDQRILRHGKPPASDLWIQAASIGEAYLASEILACLQPSSPVRLLLTATTSQGVDILHQAVGKLQDLAARQITCTVSFFPLDIPRIMEQAVEAIKPRLMVLLETEIWPAHLAALKNRGCRILIVNGRLSERSVRRYSLIPGLWRRIAPNAVLAVSQEDKERFLKLFGSIRAETMHNIKFDRLPCPKVNTGVIQSLSGLLPDQSPFIVLGSVRREEEKQVAKLIAAFLPARQNAVIGLFPRHLPRVAKWGAILTKNSVPWVLRSEITKPVAPGTVIIWDQFGELSSAYEIASAAFVGGSLASTGGQNFLEPLNAGVTPVIGPFWDNFYWVGEEIFKNGLARKAADWRIACDILLQDVNAPHQRQKVKEAARRYMGKRQGGTARACKVISEFLEESLGKRGTRLRNGR